MADRKSDLAFAAFFGSGKSGGGGASDNAVLYTQQTLTAAQQAQARENIGAVSLDEIGTVFTLKGGVPTVEDLPASGNHVGDVYYVEAVSAGYIWLTNSSQPGGYWEELGETFDVTVDSELSTTSENPVQNKVIYAALAKKGTYSKPSGGIPKSDLSSAAQTSLGKADTALQSVPNTYRTAAAQDLIDEAQDARINQKANTADLAEVATTGNYNDLSNKPTIPSLSGYATETWVTNKGYQTAVQVQTAISGKADKSALDAHTSNTTIHVTAEDKTAWNGKQDAVSDLATIRSGAAAGATAVQPGSLATVATSGNYNDLSNKPAIPTVPTDEISANTAARHTHSNKSLLDTYTQTEANLADAVSKKHTHSNKTTLDGITAAKLLPTVTTSDNDKFLRVVNGAWAAATVPSAETANF